jgi:hypothetical protein
VFLPFAFKWNAVSGADAYQIEVAKDADFNELIYKRDLADNSFDAVNVSMDMGVNYFWRITSRKLGVSDVVSEVYSFVLVDEPKCLVTAPSNNAEDVSQTPLIKWDGLGEGYTYEVQVALNNDFSAIHYQQSNIEETEITVPANKLTSSTNYYLRVRGVSQELVSAWSDLIAFKTLFAVPDVPVILSPSEGENVGVEQVAIKIKEDARAKSFTVWLSKSSSFPWTDRKVLTIPAFTYEGVYNNLDLTNYYVKVRANFDDAMYTAWSSVRSFNGVATAIDDVAVSDLKINCSTHLTEMNELVTYELSKPGMVELVLYNITGKRLYTLVNKYLEAGDYEVNLPTATLKRGMYILMIQTESERKTLKLIN